MGRSVNGASARLKAGSEGVHARAKGLNLSAGPRIPGPTERLSPFALDCTASEPALSRTEAPLTERPIQFSSVQSVQSVQFSSVQLCREMGRARARQTVPRSGPRRVPGEAIGCKGRQSFRHCRNSGLYLTLRLRSGLSRNREFGAVPFQSVSVSVQCQFSSVQLCNEPGRARVGQTAPLGGSRRVPGGAIGC